MSNTFNALRATPGYIIKRFRSLYMSMSTIGHSFIDVRVLSIQLTTLRPSVLRNLNNIIQLSGIYFLIRLGIMLSYQ